MRTCSCSRPSSSRSRCGPFIACSTRRACATVRNYLAAPEVNLVYGRRFARFTQPERRLFPGFVAVALALIGALPRKHEDTNPERSTFVPSWLRGLVRSPQFAYVLGVLVAY